MLAAARKENGLSQKEVAAAVEVSRERISGLECSSDMLVSTLLRYARAARIGSAEIGAMLGELQE